GQDRHAGNQADQGGGAGDDAEADRIGGQLGDQGLVGGALDPGLGDEEAGGDGDDDGGDLGHQAVAHGQGQIAVGGVADRHAVLERADQYAADGVDEDDDQAGDGVAADEFRGAVHGPEEGRFLFQFLAPAL